MKEKKPRMHLAFHMIIPRRFQIAEKFHLFTLPEANIVVVVIVINIVGIVIIIVIVTSSKCIDFPLFQELKKT